MVKKTTLFIDGMTCGNCEGRIKVALSMLEGVERVHASFNRAKVEIHFDENRVLEKTFIETIEKLGYGVVEKPKSSLEGVIPLMALLFGGFYIIQNTMGFNFIPDISEGMGYGLLFVVGILTSVHCIAMCGGLALSQSIHTGNQKGKFIPSLLYNIGRVISYTVIGGIVGGLGSVITPTGEFKGVVAIGAGIFMFLMGLKMLNILRLPHWLGLKIPGVSFGRVETANPLRPLILGLFNGLMPCGPLQTMQLYALGTGSVTKGALAMFVFSIGTVPLLFLFGAITSMINGKLSRQMLKISATLVMVLGIVMLSRGLALSGITVGVGATNNTQNQVTEITMEDGKQIINMTVNGRGYTPDRQVVQVGVPVKIKLNVESINGCSNPITIPGYGIQVDLTSQDPVMEFTPTKAGPIRISCWMGMITTKLTAVEGYSNGAEQPLSGGKGSVPTENRAVGATISGDMQTIEMNIGEYGYSPNILVVQRGITTRWIINLEEGDGYNNTLVIPDAQFSQELTEGANEIRFTPQRAGELIFIGGRDGLRGKIVIVDDIESVDMETLENGVL